MVQQAPDQGGAWTEVWLSSAAGVRVTVLGPDERAAELKEMCGEMAASYTEQ
jgi:hypothetical protein